jgi:cellulose synthase/poly-beta-1,6-N-acetylglucosamine synthase-like glycosyltransferase
MWTILSISLLVVVSISVGYLYLILLGGLRRWRQVPPVEPNCRFAVAIPAHNEEGVIGRTVSTLLQVDYPGDMVDIHVVADFCTDNTAQVARETGAICHERSDGARGGKGAALDWLLGQIWQRGEACDAVIIFDADTRVDTGFLRAMAARLASGERAVQGQHRIRNPKDGWYPALVSAIFHVNNRVFNQGRANLGLSAMNMGDSICVRSDVLRRIGWGEGLTEDYDLRLLLLLQGIRIAYEPAATASGEAPVSWADAASQRKRWLAGTYGSTRRNLRALLGQVRVRRDAALLDSVAQMVLPSYSTLTVLAAAVLGVQLAARELWRPIVPTGLLVLWGVILGLLMGYPLLGLALDRAPLRAFLVILIGPLFVVWRTGLAVGSRFVRPPKSWVRTPRRGT